MPGDNLFGPIVHDEELLASRDVCHIAQPIVALAGETRAALQQARDAVKLDLQALRAVFSIDQTIAAGEFLGQPRHITRGDVAEKIARSEHVLEGSLCTGGQEHFYLETQAAPAVPGEHGWISVYSSTQNPSEVQALVAYCVGLRQNQAVCIARRKGGAFGGKESQAAHPALLAAPWAQMQSAGAPGLFAKPRHARHRQETSLSLRFRVGFDSDGRIEAVSLELYSDCGSACDLCLAVMDRSILHTDNAYSIAHFSVIGRVCRTNLPPNTAMRGFGAPQGIAAIENVIEEIAEYLSIDPVLVRRRNCHGGEGRSVTPYGQVVSRSTLPLVIDTLAESAEYSK